VQGTTNADEEGALKVLYQKLPDCKPGYGTSHPSTRSTVIIGKVTHAHYGYVHTSNEATASFIQGPVAPRLAAKSGLGVNANIPTKDTI
jgi:hypothetical protein